MSVFNGILHSGSTLLRVLTCLAANRPDASPRARLHDARQRQIKKNGFLMKAASQPGDKLRFSLVGSTGLFLLARRSSVRAALTAHWAVIHSRPLLALSPLASNKKRPEFSDLPLPGDRSGDAGGVDRARTYDLHDVNVAL